MSTPQSQPSNRNRRILKIVVQLVGFAGALILLGWCVNMAFASENREQLALLQEASLGQILALLGLSSLTLILNGLIFWITLSPVRRLRCGDVVAVNALAIFLNYLPFKIGAITRVVIHNRRDKVPLLTIGAWFIAIGIIMLASIGSVIATSIWRPSIDLVWVGGVLITIMLAMTGIVGLSRVFEGQRGLDRLHRMLDPLHLKPIQAMFGTALFKDLHAGFIMLAAAGPVGATMVMRLADLTTQAARFLIAATVLGVVISPGEAVLLAAMYFVIGSLSPVGMLGTREGATTGLAAALAIAESEQFVLVALLVTATEGIVNIAGAGLGLAWLRPDRLLRLRNQPVAEPATQPSGTAPDSETS